MFDLLADNSSFMHFLTFQKICWSQWAYKQIQKFNIEMRICKSWAENYKFWNVLNLRGWSNRKTNRKVCMKHKRNNLTHVVYLSFLFKRWLWRLADIWHKKCAKLQQKCVNKLTRAFAECGHFIFSLGLFTHVRKSGQEQSCWQITAVNSYSSSSLMKIWISIYEPFQRLPASNLIIAAVYSKS